MIGPPNMGFYFPSTKGTSATCHIAFNSSLPKSKASASSSTQDRLPDGLAPSSGENFRNYCGSSVALTVISSWFERLKLAQLSCECLLPMRLPSSLMTSPGCCLVWTRVFPFTLRGNCGNRNLLCNYHRNDGEPLVRLSNYGVCLTV
jgi:hypothetical protein